MVVLNHGKYIENQIQVFIHMGRMNCMMGVDTYLISHLI